MWMCSLVPLIKKQTDKHHESLRITPHNTTHPYRFQILALLRTHEYAGAEDAAVQVGRIYPIAEATNAISTTQTQPVSRKAG